MCDVSFVPDWAQIWRLLPGPTKLTEMTANFEEGKYEIHVLSKVTEDNVHPLQCFAYLCKVTHDVTRIRAFLEEEKRKFCLHPVYSKTFPWKGPPSNTVKLIMESGGFKEEKQFDRNKVDGMSFGEKKVYTLPKCTGKTMTFTATVINEEGNIPLLVTEPFDIGLSRPVLMEERRPAVEHDDLMPQAAHQSRSILMLLIFIFHIATMRRPLF